MVKKQLLTEKMRKTRLSRTNKYKKWNAGN